MSQGTTRAFTLLEVLIVVVLLALAAALGAHAMLGAGEVASWKSAEAALREFDARARMLARRDGGVVIGQDAAKESLVARANGAPVVALVLPQRARAFVEGGRPLPIDRLGRSGDATYRIEIDGFIRRVRVAGLTGQISALDEKGGASP